jgi:hypothetical protein
MPVPRAEKPQPGTATAVVSTGTSSCARVGIEERSVLTASGVVKLRRGKAGAETLPSPVPVTTVSASMPSANANFDRFPGVNRFRAILFAKFALLLPSS